MTGRPPMDAQKKRTKTVVTYLSQSENDMFQTFLEKKDISVSQWLRSCILSAISSDQKDSLENNVTIQVPDSFQQKQAYQGDQRMDSESTNIGLVKERWNRNSKGDSIGEEDVQNAFAGSPFEKINKDSVEYWFQNDVRTSTEECSDEKQTSVSREEIEQFFK